MRITSNYLYKKYSFARNLKRFNVRNSLKRLALVNYNFHSEGNLCLLKNIKTVFLNPEGILCKNDTLT
jgi:hypothetical protein